MLNLKPLRHTPTLRSPDGWSRREAVTVDRDHGSRGLHAVLDHTPAADGAVLRAGRPIGAERGCTRAASPQAVERGQ